MKGGIWAFMNDAHTVAGYGEEAKIEDGIYDVYNMYLFMKKFGIKEFVGYSNDCLYGDNDVWVKKSTVSGVGMYNRWGFDKLFELLCNLKDKICNEGEVFEADRKFVMISKRFRDSGDVIVYCGGLEDDNVRYGIKSDVNVIVDSKLFSSVVRVYEVGGCDIYIKKNHPIVFDDGIVVMIVAPKIIV